VEIDSFVEKDIPLVVAVLSVLEDITTEVQLKSIPSLGPVLVALGTGYDIIHRMELNSASQSVPELP